MLSSQRAEYLLAELCTRLGLCLPLEVQRRLVTHIPADADAFTSAVFAAEGLDRSPSHRTLYRQALELAERAYDGHRPADT